MTKPIWGTFRIPTTIEPHPNTFVVIAIVASVTVRIIDTFLTHARFLAAVWCRICAVLVISASFFAPVKITILVFGAQVILPHTTLLFYTLIVDAIPAHITMRRAYAFDTATLCGAIWFRFRAIPFIAAAPDTFPLRTIVAFRTIGINSTTIIQCTNVIYTFIARPILITAESIRIFRIRTCLLYTRPFRITSAFARPPGHYTIAIIIIEAVDAFMVPAFPTTVLG